MIDPDDRDFTGVEGAITAPAFAVVVRSVRIQAGAAVVGIAFGFFGAGFFFRRFGRGFFFSKFPLFALSHEASMASSRVASRLPSRFAQSHGAPMEGAPLRFPAHLPCLRGPLFFGFAVRAAAAA